MEVEVLSQALLGEPEGPNWTRMKGVCCAQPAVQDQWDFSCFSGLLCVHSACVCDACVCLSVQVTYSCVCVWGQEDTGCPYSLEQDFPLNLGSITFQSARIADQQAVMTLCLPHVPVVLGLQPHLAFTWVLGILAQVLMLV